MIRHISYVYCFVTALRVPRVLASWSTAARSAVRDAGRVRVGMAGGEAELERLLQFGPGKCASGAKKARFSTVLCGGSEQACDDGAQLHVV